jgi:hypothetical protein
VTLIPKGYGDKDDPVLYLPPAEDPCEALEVIQTGAELVDLTGARLWVEIGYKEFQAFRGVARRETKALSKELRPLGQLFGLSAEEFESDPSAGLTLPKSAW